ncbi:hypothetical protein [Microbacterium sp.]|nr:hypothetical protein [Microbacterium sp.]
MATSAARGHPRLAAPGGSFPPAIDPPEGADDETRLLCAVVFWQR